MFQTTNKPPVQRPTTPTSPLLTHHQKKLQKQSKKGTADEMRKVVQNNSPYKIDSLEHGGVLWRGIVAGRPYTAPDHTARTSRPTSRRPVSSSDGRNKEDTYYYNDSKRKVKIRVDSDSTPIPPRPSHIPRRRPPTVTKQPSSRPRALSVVLPPRDLIKSLSSLSLVWDEDEGKEVKGGEGEVKVCLKFGSSYSGHKKVWVKNALECLGSSWVREGKISVEQLGGAELEEKVGVLYDLAIGKGHGAIDTLSGLGGGAFLSLKKVGEAVKGNKNFPFSAGLSEEARIGMGEALLRILLRGGGCDGEEKGHVSGVVEKEERECCCEERERNDGDEVVVNSKSDQSSASNSFENDLKKKKSLVQCYVVDGGKLVVGTRKGLLGVGGSFVNRFGGCGGSRGRKYQQEQGQGGLSGLVKYPFFRRTANLMGFLPHEVKIRYCKENRQLIVSGARPMRDGENARQVREVIEVPRDVDIRGLVVMRTGKGSLVFEDGGGGV